MTVESIITATHAAEQPDRAMLERIVTVVADYSAAVAAARIVFPEWRLGQTHVNVLEAMRPDLRRLVKNTDADPFYRDDAVPAYLEWLAVQL